MKRASSFVILLVAAFAACLWAADFWQTKPFTDWSDKEVQKILASSPWSKQLSVEGVGSGGAQSGGRRGGGSRDMPPDPGQISTPGAGPAGSTDPGGLGRYSGSQGDPGAPGGVALINLTVRWQSAMPVREAIVKAKYGSEAGTSPEAKKMLETPLDHYIIAVGGVPQAMLGPSAAQLKNKLLQNAALLVKGKASIQANDVMIQENGRASELMFAFPKTAPITEQDKDVEFAVKVGDVNIRQKFRVKDMMLNGKLDL